MTTETKSFGRALGRRLVQRGSRGFTLVEILVTLAIFTIILGGFFSAYLTQLKHTSRETKGAESEIELGIAKGVLLRDLELAGYGLADDYNGTGFSPKAALGNDGGSNADDLILTGTALSLKNRAAQEWTYMSDAVPNFHSWSDVREDVAAGDRVILMEPSTKTLLTEGGAWLFQYNGSGAAPTTVPAGTAFSNPTAGTLAYALYSTPPGGTEAAAPYWTVRYYLGGGRPDSCAVGTSSLERNESDDPNAAMNPNPLLACVLDMEVAFGLDTDENGTIDTWDDGAKIVKASNYSEEMLRKRLKTVKVYLLVQSGSRDRDYTFPVASLQVGETLGGTTVGRSVDLTDEQRHYRWRMVSITKTLRNLQ